MISPFAIAGRAIGPSHPCYIIAELSANHAQQYEQAAALVHAAYEAGADAVKLQTYRPDTITLRSDRPEFRVGGGTIWDGRTLYDLYQEAHTPWEWHRPLQKLANDLGLHFFSTPFDPSAVDFLESLEIPAYKVASFELVDLPLIEKIAALGKPMIMSTGMATLEEISEAVATCLKNGNGQLVLLKCTSAYPALPDAMNLRSLVRLSETFQTPVGLSDHTLGIEVPIVAVALGACIVEKHLTLNRSDGGPDSSFSLEPAEFAAMVRAVRLAQKSIGMEFFGVGADEEKSVQFRRSLYVVADMVAGQEFSPANVRSVRPAVGLAPKYLNEVLGRRSNQPIPCGTPLSWELVDLATARGN